MARKMVEFEPFEEPSGSVEVEESWGILEQAPTKPPKELEDWAASKAKHLTFVRDDAVLLSQESVYYRYPVLVSDLPESLRDTGKLSQLGFEDPSRWGGKLRRSDCVLTAQPLAARDYFRREVARQNADLDEYKALHEDRVREIIEANNAQSKNRLMEIRPENAGKISEHVLGGRDLASRAAR